MIITTNMLPVLNEEWELLEVQEAKQEQEETVFQELWINRQNNEQEIIERHIYNG